MSDNPYVLRVPFGGYQKNAFMSVDFSPINKVLVSGGDIDYPGDIGIRFWGLDELNASEKKSLKGLKANKVRFSPDGSWIAFLRSSSEIIIFNTSSEQYFTLEKHNAPVHSINFCTQGNLLASGDDKNEIYLWDIETWSAKSVRGDKHYNVHSWSGEGIFVVAFTPDSKLLASGGADNTIRFWDVETGEQRSVIRIADLQYPQGVYNLVFSPDGQIMVVATEQAEIQIWDWKAEEKIRSLYQFRDEGNVALSGLVVKMAFSPDGSLLAAGTSGNLRLWGIGDVIKGNAGYSLKIPDHHPITDLVFNPTGNMLASAHANEARLWKIHMLCA